MMNNLRAHGVDSLSYSSSSTASYDGMRLGSGVNRKEEAQRFMSSSSEYSDDSQYTTAADVKARSCSTTRGETLYLPRTVNEGATLEPTKRGENNECSKRATGFESKFAKLVEWPLDVKRDDLGLAGSSVSSIVFDKKPCIKSHSQESIADSGISEEIDAGFTARQPFDTHTYSVNDSVNDWIKNNPLCERAREEVAPHINVDDIVEQYKGVLANQLNAFNAQLKQLESQIKLLEAKNAALSAELKNERKQPQHAAKPNLVNESSVPKIIDQPASLPAVVKPLTENPAHVDYGKHSVQYQKNSEPQGNYYPQSVFVTPVMYGLVPVNIIWNGQTALGTQLYPVYPVYPVPIFTYTSSFCPVRYI